MLQDSILLVTNDPPLEKAVHTVFARQHRRPGIHVADSIERAAILIRRAPPEALVLDAVIGQKEIDFVEDFQTMLPHANILLVSEKPDSCVPLISKGLAVRFLPKPVPSRELQAVLLSIMHPDWQTPAPNFEAHLTSVILVDVLQMKLNCGQSSRLEVVGEGPNPGVLDITNGRILSAKLGASEGPQAFCEIMSWTKGAVLEQPFPATVSQNIFMSADRLLLEAAAIADQAGESSRKRRGTAREASRRMASRRERLDHADAHVQKDGFDFQSTPKILVVEDNPFMLSFLEILIGEIYPSHIILCAPTGGDGIECALLYKPALVLLDRTLPDISSELFYEKLRKQDGFGDTPVLVMSGRLVPTPAEWAALFAGAALFLQKPFTSEELCVALGKLLPLPPDSAQSTREL